MNLLLFQESRLTRDHRDVLEQAVPGIRATYCENTAGPEQLAEADIIVGNPPPALLAHCRKLQLLQLCSAGTDGYLPALPAGAVLANATGGYGLAISEHMLAMALHLMKRLHQYGENQRQGLWRDEGPVKAIYGSTVLVVGLGDIGGEFARRVHAMGGAVIGVRRAGTDKPDYLDELHLMDKLDQLLPRADLVALCLPGTPQTKGLIDAGRLGLLRPDAILLNVGRGTAVDAMALNEALRQGRLGGAGLDVTDPEPLPSGHPLWEAPNLIITPHVSGGNHLPETYRRIVGIAAENIRAVAEGRPIRNEVDPETGYRKL